VVILGAFVGGFVANMLIQGYGYANLNNKLVRLENKMNSGLGVEVKQEKAQRMQSAMAEAMLIMKDEAIAKEDKTKALLGLAGKYPDVAFDLVKKVGVKGLI
jgi:hypothetical protein